MSYSHDSVGHMNSVKPLSVGCHQDAVEKYRGTVG